MAVVIPSMGPGLAGTQITVSARSILQASRYARTMAILHQANTELVLTSAQNLDGVGLIEVRAASTFNAADATPKIEVEEEETDDSKESRFDDWSFSDEEDEASSTNNPSMPSTESVFNEAIASKFECKGISFVFEGYDDVVDGENDFSTTDDEEVNEEYPEIVLKFNSNGTCRPFTVRVRSGDELSYLVKVNAIGVGKIEEYGDDEE